ncbi:alpha/beta hydrolase family protein [Actinopolymorpha alba]|uniref:alpha/beta hydrolase family protein n=1 Tax=Actinopolymorpha alba TaxID=533267 RepID=UPI000A0693AF|nr:lipase [Actinopolymorpha alba]
MLPGRQHSRRTQFRSRRRLGTLATVVAAGLLTLAGTPASAGPVVETHRTATATPYLPKPTGAHLVGTTSLHLKDTSRPDPWVPEAEARELMVSLWYPARSRAERPAPYMTPKESELLMAGAGVTGVPPEVLSGTRTNAYNDAKPAGGKRSLPLAVLSPGFTWPRSSLTALAEDLASRGYVVVGIDHTYESFATTFPDGRVATCAACEVPGEGGDEFGTKVVKGRAADISFVLDELTGAHPKWQGASLIDPSRIAMAGSSIGGASVAETMLRDSRVRAGINMDGTMFAPIPEPGLSRPVLFLGQEAHGPAGFDPTWERDWKRLTGWKRWLVVAGSVHASFTDYDLLTQQIGVDLGSELAGPRSVEITRRYVRAFFDLHLRDKRQPLLRGPSARYPEVRFCTPDTTTCA